MEHTKITIQTLINAPIDKVWRCWTTPEDIMGWNSASPNWHTPQAKNDLRKDGSFSYRMESKDAAVGFDFAGVYDLVVPSKEIAYTLGDGRKVAVSFSVENSKVKVVETFEAETLNSLELQQHGWQAILDNFKTYVETKISM